MPKYFANTSFIGKPAFFLPKCHSTNDIASEMASKKSAKEGTLIYTNDQFLGRGQRGNTWKSQPGKNLTFSVIFHPGFLRISDHFLLNIFTSLALHDFLTVYTPENLKIKWPNDIMYGGSKIAGILIENSIRSNRFEYSAIGIGLNINQQEFQMENAISMLQICNQEFNIDEMLELLSMYLENRYNQLKSLTVKSLYRDYMSVMYWKDEIHVFRSNETFNGMIRGIDDSGRLMVETDHGVSSYMFKEIEYLR
ncbi:biotin--[acetyl-CoA-carboxylase] ligase [Bacteroidota bacterium]